MISRNVTTTIPPESGVDPDQHVVSRWDHYEPWVFLAALGIAELLSDRLAPATGIWMHAMLAGWLLVRGGQKVSTARGKFYIAISTMALVRIISFAISPKLVPGIWYYVAAETPLMLFALIGAWSLELPVLKTLGAVWPKRGLGWSALVVVSSPVIGWLEGHILHPTALSANGSLSAIIIPALLLTAFTGFSEEWLFRGLIQSTAAKWMGPVAALIFTAIGWGLLHIGWNSGIDVVFVMSVGVFWCWIRMRTESTWATAIAHGIANVVLFCVLPWHANLYLIPTLWH